MLAIRLPEELERRLANLARRTGRTKTFYAREAIETHLEDLEDIYLAELELQRVQDGDSTTYALEEVMRAHGLRDQGISYGDSGYMKPEELGALR